MDFVGTPLPPLIISGRNTYEYWDMIPTSRLYVEPPEVKTNYADLPGANSGIDYTELLTGYTTYNYRKGSWEFMLIPQERWNIVYNSLIDYLHGHVHTVILSDDPNYAYTGRLSINEWATNEHSSIITINYILDPERKQVDPDYDPYYESDMQAAARLLRKSENRGKIIVLNNDMPVIISPESDEQAAARILSKYENIGKVIALQDNTIIVVTPESLIEDGDNIHY